MARADGEALRHSVRGLVERPAGRARGSGRSSGPVLVEPVRLQSVLVSAGLSRLTRPDTLRTRPRDYLDESR